MFASDFQALRAVAAIEFDGTEYRIPATAVVRSIISERAIGHLVARDGDFFVFSF